MAKRPDQDDLANVVARLSLIGAVAACICLGGAVALWISAGVYGAAEISLKRSANVLVYVSAGSIAVAFVCALVAIGQFMFSRVPRGGHAHVHAALLLGFLWTAGMILWQRLAG